MRCNECRSLLYDFMDENLREGTVDSVQKHLGSCQECAVQFENERRFSQLVRNAVNHQTTDLRYNPHFSPMEMMNTIHKAEKTRKLAWLASTLLRPIPLILILLIASVLLFFTSPWKFFKEKSLVFDDRQVMEQLNSMPTNPLTDWTERRLVVTIYDSNGNLRQTIITSRSEEDIIGINNEEIKK